MIVDDADVDIEMSEDPFKEAGICAPPNLPYTDKNQVWKQTEEELVSIKWLSDFNIIRNVFGNIIRWCFKLGE